MNEMVERVASVLRGELERAPEEDVRAGIGALLALAPEGAGEAWLRSVARAVVEAMRTPTEAMVERGADARILNYDGSDTREVWQLMIDAALKDDSASEAKP